MSGSIGIPFDASPGVRVALNRLGRTEDVRFSPSDRRLVLPSSDGNSIATVDADITSGALVEERIAAVEGSRTSALRGRAGERRWSRAAQRRFGRARRSAAETHEVIRLGLSRRRIPPPRDDSAAVVSLASFPARINHAWIPIETMFRQDQVPDRIVLVLSDDEFPRRELPRKIVNQQARGLEILWVPRTARSLNKLVPTRRAYPDATIITIDDDALYEPWVVSSLIAQSRARPGTVIGHGGWTIQHDDHGLVPYNDWARASPDTPAEQVFLTGVGGILYPSGVLPIEILADTDLATKLCPTADDVWFWAVASVAGVPAHCLGRDSHRELRQQAHTPQLQTINRGERQNDVQLARVIEYFGLQSRAR